MVDPFDIVIFGGSGDLAFRKLVPALYRAHLAGKLPAGSRIIPACRKPKVVENYIETIEDALQQHLGDDEFCPDAWQNFKEFIFPVVLNVPVMEGHWHALSKFMSEEKEKARVFYLAIPPSIFGICCQHLAEVLRT